MRLKYLVTLDVDPVSDDIAECIRSEIQSNLESLDSYQALSRVSYLNRDEFTIASVEVVELASTVRQTPLTPDTYAALTSALPPCECHDTPATPLDVLRPECQTDDFDRDDYDTTMNSEEPYE